MRNSRQSMSGLLAVAGLMMAAGATPIATGMATNQVGRQPPKPRPYRPVMKTAKDREIAEWNAAVEAKRQAKKGRKP